MIAAAPQRRAIVGGGMLGMTLALRLAQRGQRVTLFEAAPHLGGLADAWRLGDVTWDRHYHVTLLSDTHFRNLLTELGLEQEMRWVETRTGFYTDGRLHSMSNTLEFLRFPPLGLIDKLRLGATIFYASKVRDWRRLESVPVADWLRRLSGRHVFEQIWLPLLRAKLGENYRRTSAAFIWATIARMYAARRTGLKKEMFGYVPGGYARILTRFAEALTEADVEIRTSHAATQITATDDGPTIHFADGKERHFDQVVLTAPAPVVSHLCPGLSGDEHARFRGVEYQGIVCASVLLKQPLAGYYVTNITEPWVPFTAVIETSALVDRAEFGGASLVYLPKYVAPDDPIFEESDAEIEARFTDALARMYPDFRRDDVLAFRVSRVRHVMPLPTLGYSDRLPPPHTSLPGVFAINSAHIVNGTLNVNETVKLAEDAVQRVLFAPATAPTLAPPLSKGGAGGVAARALGAYERSKEPRSLEETGVLENTPISQTPRATPPSPPLLRGGEVKASPRLGGEHAKPIASLSLDLDNKWSYLKTHGDAGWEAFPSYLDTVVPRFLDFLRERDLTITVFVVGQDAALDKNRDALASISAAGHEIGNHSFRHEPWLHLYSEEEIDAELARAEEHLERVTGERPAGFRGPGFSQSPTLFRVLARRGYEYDGSTFPTFLGPLARLYYFLTARLDDEQKRQRKLLFGRFREGFRSLRPHWIENDEGRLLEIPVTTMPVFKLPIHVSYLLYLGQFSRRLALTYFRTALGLCRATGVAPSLLLHPLDFLGADDDSDLAFFPAMRLPAARKLALVGDILRLFTDRYRVVTMREHAAFVGQISNLPVTSLRTPVSSRDRVSGLAD